jgi:hypothetical protein
LFAFSLVAAKALLLRFLYPRDGVMMRSSILLLGDDEEVPHEHLIQQEFVSYLSIKSKEKSHQGRRKNRRIKSSLASAEDAELRAELRDRVRMEALQTEARNALMEHHKSESCRFG